MSKQPKLNYNTHPPTIRNLPREAVNAVKKKSKETLAHLKKMIDSLRS